MCKRRKKQGGAPMAKQVAEPARTDYAFRRPMQTSAIVPVTENEKKPAVRVITQYISTSISILPEQVPTAQELAFREELHKEIVRLEGILADGTYTAEDQANARDSLRAAGIIDENDELLPYFQPAAGEE